MFVGWEGVGLCSYLLIGYYIDKKEAGDAAKKAFITNRIGDWGFVLGIMLTFFVTGSVSFFAKPAAGEVTHTALSFFKTCVEPFTGRSDLCRRRYVGRGAAVYRRRRKERADTACTFGCLMRWPVRRRFRR